MRYEVVWLTPYGWRVEGFRNRPDAEKFYYSLNSASAYIREVKP